MNNYRSIDNWLHQKSFILKLWTLPPKDTWGGWVGIQSMGQKLENYNSLLKWIDWLSIFIIKICLREAITQDTCACSKYILFKENAHFTPLSQAALGTRDIVKKCGRQDLMKLEMETTHPSVIITNKPTVKDWWRKRQCNEKEANRGLKTQAVLTLLFHPRCNFKCIEGKKLFKSV